MTIVKYTLNTVSGPQTVQMPYNSSLLSVKAESTGFSIYTSSDVAEPLADYKFYLLHTGDAIPAPFGQLYYVDTLVGLDSLTYHIFME
jgi:hypothetical protein